MFLQEFFKKYIKDSPEKAVVANRRMLLCHLTKAVIEGINIDNSVKNVYVTSRCVKHLFDKKPAEEFFFILDYLHKIVKYPDRIYKNRNGKRGNFCFVKKVGNEKYICAIEILETSLISADSGIKEIIIATAFRLRDEKYIKNYTLLWDWGNGNPHRSALDAPKESTNAPQ